MSAGYRRPRWLPWLAAVVAILAFAGLGTWQVERAEQRAEQAERIAAAKNAAPQPLPQTRAEQRARAWLPVRVHGRYLDERQFLLDNRQSDGRLGFAVLTPLVSRDGRTLLVERGWVAAERREPATPVSVPGERTGTITVVGTLWPAGSGLDIGRALAQGADDWPRVATRIDYAALGSALGRELEPYVVRLRRPDGPELQRRTVEPSFGPERHIGYAFQWYALALTVLVVTLWLGWRKGRKQND